MKSKFIKILKIKTMHRKIIPRRNDKSKSTEKHLLNNNPTDIFLARQGFPTYPPRSSSIEQTSRGFVPLTVSPNIKGARERRSTCLPRDIRVFVNAKSGRDEPRRVRKSHL